MRCFEEHKKKLRNSINKQVEDYLAIGKNIKKCVGVSSKDVIKKIKRKRLIKKKFNEFLL